MKPTGCNLFITGKPGVGKTTLVEKIAKSLGNRCGGFFSREIRVSGTRVGFSIHTLEGGEGVLAHVDLDSPSRVGRYGVNLQDIEELAVPSILKAKEAGKVVVIDEIARMELFSSSFKEAVLKALDAPSPLLATLQDRRDPFLDRVRKRKDVSLIYLTPKNRSYLEKEIRLELLES
jgi:nucleoside-triphosphatase